MTLVDYAFATAAIVYGWLLGMATSPFYRFLRRALAKKNRGPVLRDCPEPACAGVEFDPCRHMGAGR